ncbi:MAG: hypothetical protein AM325_006795 [Candidatus Thorarchaeota archaeon SMTZ1-45]|nr:MAG: hypothetical protein AM325_08545 [Candidatus Thorarchaeota archaeon SMTZ1-45]
MSVSERSGKIFVESEYLTRCEWCGTPYSPGWVGTESGRIYCSTECQSAEHTEYRKAGGVFVMVLGLVMILSSIFAGISSYGAVNVVSLELLAYGAMILLLGFCILAQAIEGQGYKDRKDKYRDAQLLVCEYCNHICAPGVVDCDNCGATLVDAQFAKDPWPEWFVPPKPKKKFGPCRNCGTSFKYPVTSADGKDRCPRCGKTVFERE